MKGTVANPVRTWQESLRATVFQLSVQLQYSSLPGAFQVRPATLLAHCYPYNPGELEAPAGLWGLGSRISRGVRHRARAATRSAQNAAARHNFHSAVHASLGAAFML